MKMFITILLAVATLFGSKAQKNNEGIKSYMNKAIENKKYTIEATIAYPSRGTIHLTSEYDLKVSGDSVYMHLPFYGRAHTAPYGGSGGIKAENLYEKYKVTTKKKQTNISFDVKTLDDFYRVHIVVWENGKADLRIQPQNRSFISFSGQMEIPQLK